MAKSYSSKKKTGKTRSKAAKVASVSATSDSVLDSVALPAIECWFQSEKTAFQLDDGGRITAWFSKQGNGGNAVQNDAAFRAAPATDAATVLFDNAYFDMPHLTESAFVSSNQLTVGLNIRFIPDAVTTPRVILSKGDFTSRTVYLDFHQNRLRIKLGNAGLKAVDISPWYGKQVRLIVVADGTTYSVFIDDQPVMTDVVYGAIGADEAPFRLGARDAGERGACPLTDTAIASLVMGASAATEAQRLHLSRYLA
ncbi:hypothetical protein ABI_20240 [Asticcacaulis biprosthecium C19]|uniref:LamG domain-containing protein n=1 Tax=Asticcacaulis biprosthecium C19 TaxID=715226 RepID=F4QM12_9CAUL|nr:hypothetical protein [Asticcacaulis biprosthecium]EGF93584.1 hypothetical protein ABI_20240 [Asticcacaulis biprosthecium C19]